MVSAFVFLILQAGIQHGARRNIGFENAIEGLAVSEGVIYKRVTLVDQGHHPPANAA